MALASTRFMHSVDSLGEPRFDSPLDPSSAAFVSGGAGEHEHAGPRERVFFEPQSARAAIVTCGGLCPGTNNVIRAIFLTLFHRYGVRAVTGFRFGLAGMVAGGPDALRLTPEVVRHAHRIGGTLLGTSRGRQSETAIVDTLERLSIDMLFMVGGNGTIRAAADIQKEIARRKRPIAVVVVPKTIDDDVPVIDKTFGFETAVTHAAAAIDAAHAEALGAQNGVGMVKLMGRDAGFVAAHATIASGEANFCLLPEVPFDLDAFFVELRERVTRRGHAVVVVAEGCGACLEHPGAERDASGNLRYASHELDIGVHLRDAMKTYFAVARVPITIKYIDPSYTIRAAVADANDAVYATRLAIHAAHAAMAGRTNVLVGRIHGEWVHVPLELVSKTERRVDRDLWLTVREITGQSALAKISASPLATK
jgi:6-phosphofructokinase 1